MFSRRKTGSREKERNNAPVSRASTAIRIMVVVLVLLAAASGLLAPHFARTFGWITGDAEDAAAEKTTLPPIEPLEGPWIVAVQPGHMRIGELPEELSHRRGDTGAVYGSVREAAINRAVVDALIPLMESEGWKTVLVPATVPPGLRADVFLSIHADGSNNPAQRGWKISPPWRPSPASRGLAAELAGAFSEETGLVEAVDSDYLLWRRSGQCPKTSRSKCLISW